MMKKFLYIIPFFYTILLTSCINDKSSTASNTVSDIAISNINDSYAIVSYAGNKLEIQPTLTTDYTDLEYHWYLINKSREGKSSTTGVTYTMDSIAGTKDLSYEVSLPEGQYTIVFRASSKGNGYSMYKRASLEVTTSLSRGFYILKETTDGNTDVDLYTPDGVLMPELIAKTQGSALQGTPRSISPCFAQSYLLNKTKMVSNTIFVATNKNDMGFFRVSDFKKVIDRTNLSFGTVTDDEEAYCAIRAHYYMFLFTNKGVRTVSSGDSYQSTGKFGDPAGGCGSLKVVPSRKWLVCYWDEKSHNLMGCDYNGETHAITVPAGATYKTQGLTDYECIACGDNFVSNSDIVYYLFQDKAGVRYLYTLTCSSTSGKVKSVTTLDGALNFAKSNLITTNGTTATVAYCINNNKLYAYNLVSGTESELSLSGIPSGEQITYISNQYWNGKIDAAYNYDYFVVGTQTGNTYKLYLYTMIGGQPNGNPTKTITGTGKFKSMRLMSPNFNTSAVFNYNNVD